MLSGHYGALGWWPGPPYEIMAGAVLVQNTAWGNVEKSLANFKGRLSPAYVETLPMEELIGLIRPSGFYTAKAACLKDVTAWYKQYHYSVEKVQLQPLEKVRGELLAIRGIGQETADAILCFSFYFPTFVVDAYLKRLATRLALPVSSGYGALQAYFETGFDGDAQTMGDYHILILEHGKRHCKKRPLCPGCPFLLHCAWAKQNGVQAGG